MRVFVTDRFELRDHGAVQIYLPGEFYTPQVGIARAIVNERCGYFEEEPPECNECGETFEGMTAYSALDQHIEAEHRQDDEE